MCGIIGAVGTYCDSEIVEKATMSIRHRGTDGAGQWRSRHAFIAHSRLKIQNYEGSAQPFSSPCGRYKVGFVGEILNYKELRQTIATSYITLQTQSEAELILQTFLLFGDSFPKRLKGMFAIVLYDTLSGRVLLVRDQIGIKPIYYKACSKSLYFFSEPSGILAFGDVTMSQNYELLSEFLVFGNSSNYETFYPGVLEVPPGHLLDWRPEVCVLREYWSPIPTSYEESGEIDVADEVDKLTSVLGATFEEWGVGDANRVALLSGGLDSSLMVGHLSTIYDGLPTFTVSDRFDSIPDEQSDVESFACSFNIKPNFVATNYDNFFNDLADLAFITGEPSHDSNSLTMMYLCREIRSRTDAKILFTGDGADELFAGYSRYIQHSKMHPASRNLGPLVLGNNVVAIPRVRKLMGGSYIKLDKRVEFARRILASMGEKYDSINLLLIMDQVFFLRPYLVRQDRIGMRYGLEVRPPYLDANLVSIVNRLPSLLKYKDSFTKWILRKSGEKLIGRDFWSLEKKPFSSLFSHMLERPKFRLAMKDYLSNMSFVSAIFDIRYVHSLLDSHRSSFPDSDYSNLLWRITTLEACSGVAKSIGWACEYRKT